MGLEVCRTVIVAVFKMVMGVDLRLEEAHILLLDKLIPMLTLCSRAGRRGALPEAVANYGFHETGWQRELKSVLDLQ